MKIFVLEFKLSQALISYSVFKIINNESLEMKILGQNYQNICEILNKRQFLYTKILDCFYSKLVFEIKFKEDKKYENIYFRAFKLL